MFLLVSGRHVSAHPDGHQHGVSITLDARGLFVRQQRGASERLAFAASPLISVTLNEKKNLWHPGYVSIQTSINLDDTLLRIDSRDLILGEVVYIAINYHIPDS